MKLFTTWHNPSKAARSADFSPLQHQLLHDAETLPTAFVVRWPKRTKVRAPFGSLLRGLAVLLIPLGWITGCESTDGGSTQVSSSVYYGVGFYDPWHYGDHHYDYDDVATPPRPDTPPDRPPGRPPGQGAHPSQPIARPPDVSSRPPTASPRPAARPMPSIPSTPRAAPRGGGGGRR